MKANNGTYAEHNFIALATKAGLVSAFPLQVMPYDVLIDNGTHIFRVQIKSKYTSFKNNYRVKLTNNKTYQLKYNTSNVDIIAFYIGDQYWYFIPIKDIKQKSLRFNPHNIKMKTTKYMENWSIFNAK